jgi:hypothetical protein
MASSADILVEYEKQTWALIRQKELEKFATFLADDFYDIFPDGEERSKSELLQFLSNAELKEYELTNFRVTMLNPDAAIVTYNVEACAIIQGKEISMHNAVTSGWAKREGKWLNVSAVASARR